MLPEKRGFGVQDSIQMTTFNEPSNSNPGDDAKRSPDNRYFWLITTRGILESNELESTLWVFDSQDIRAFVGDPQGRSAAPAPRAIARIAASPGLISFDTSASLISGVRWTEDSRALLFLGQDSVAENRLYRVDVLRGETEALTPPGMGVREFDFSRDVVAFTALKSESAGSRLAAKPSPEKASGESTVTGQGLEDILFPEGGHGFGTGKFLPDLWSLEGGRLRRLPMLKVDSPIPDAEHYNNVLSLSPDGGKLIRLVPVAKAAKVWAHYDPKPGFESWKIDPNDPAQTAPSNWFRLRQYELVDMGTGETVPLIAGPNAFSLAEGDRSIATWSEDGRRVLVGNVALPLDGIGPDEEARRRHSCALASVEIPSLRAQCVVFTRDAGTVMTADNPKPTRLQDASFGTTANEAVLRFSWRGEEGQTERYRYEDEQWKLIETIPGNPVTGLPPESAAHGASAIDGLSLRVKQSLNDPPILWASDLNSGRTRPLWNPNPSFGNLKFGKAVLYHWKDETGYDWKGVLILPIDYVPGKRYPLVIQTHGFQEDQFITDGAFPTAMAARPLASAGFVVLQTAWRFDHWASNQEANDQVAGFVSAIAKLDADGLVDAKRVGIIGFSRSCWHVEETLISRPDLIAAATIADGLDTGYMQYRLLGEGRLTMREEFEQIRGGATPDGDGLKVWMEEAPDFHLDRLQTPVRIEAIGPVSILTVWELYSSLRRQNKPVDLVYLPEGQHVLQRPLERLASQQGDVDWFRFWLEGYEDPDTSKAAQYRGWKQLRPSSSKR
jgi:hypothetical protein